MDRLPARHPPRRHGRLLQLAAALLVGAGMVVSWAGPAAAADITIEARALMGGNVRPGAWAAVRVLVNNDGPTISGELRIRTSQGRSIYGTAVELPNGARQEHILYAQAPLFGTRLNIDLVSGAQTVLSQEVTIRSTDAWTPTVGIIAERPEGIQGAISEVARNPQTPSAAILPLTIADLPPRVEAWAALDRLVWQDVDAAQLSAEQQEALALWLAAGGRLVIVGGTTGVAPLRGFADELLPYRPTQTVDVDTRDLAGLLGQAPDAGRVPAITGNSLGGAVLASSAGGDIIAARSTVGQGAVTLVGINPAESWLADGNAGRALWRSVLPLGMINPQSLSDDSMMVAALNNLPSVALPPIEQLFVLLVAYVALIGPVNYLVLRRLDRREWAWLTMPALVAIFAVVSYGLGASLKGSDVIVNQVAIVRGAQGSEQGAGQVYVGVFSPSRRTFEVRVPGGALLSNPISQIQFGQAEQPLDVLFGDPARLRNFEVGFGVLRGFRAEAPARTPLVEASLRLTSGRLAGTVTNHSAAPLEEVAVVYGGAVVRVGELAAGETREVSLDTAAGNPNYYTLADRIFGQSFPRDQGQARTMYTRRNVIDQLTGYGPTLASGSGGGPVLLGWSRTPALTVEVGGELPNQVGDSLYLLPLSMTVDAQATFSDATITKTILESAADGWGDQSGYYMGRGTMIVEARPSALDGRFRPSALTIALTQGEVRSLGRNGEPLEPLPDADQPDQEDPVGDPLEAEPFVWEEMPDIQLFDHQAGRWVEFARLKPSLNYSVTNPQHYVDANGRVLARFVNRTTSMGEQRWFTFLVRLEGTIE
jgi:hypothetical protein